MQSRKMAAALQWANSGLRPILLHTTSGVGHGVSIPVDAGIVAKAATYAFLFRELGMSVVLVGLTIFNAVLGLNQESKAQASLSALEKMLKNIARVRRDGQAVEVDAIELVPGDIVLMEAGNRVPADGRLSLVCDSDIFYTLDSMALLLERGDSAVDAILDR